MPNKSPRTRLDAGHLRHHGHGMGFAIARRRGAQGRPIVIGFRRQRHRLLRHGDRDRLPLQLPIKIVVLNNGGIGGGVAEFPKEGQFAAARVTIGARYDKMMEAFAARAGSSMTPPTCARHWTRRWPHPGPALVNREAAAGSHPQAAAIRLAHHLIA